MAKQNNKNNSKKDLNNNFEALKAQMMKKRLMAEEAMDKTVEAVETIKEPMEEVSVEQITKKVDYNREVPTRTVKANEDLDRYDEPPYSNTNNSLEDDFEDDYDYYNKEEVTNTPERNEGFLTVEVKQPEAQVSMNKIIIKKIEKPEQPKRITYYLKPETIKKIDRYSRMAGMGKSEFVQNILDTVLNNLEIEK